MRRLGPGAEDPSGEYIRMPQLDDPSFIRARDPGDVAKEMRWLIDTYQPERLSMEKVEDAAFCDIVLNDAIKPDGDIAPTKLA